MILVFDLDGTLTDANHRLHHITAPGKKKDWNSFFEGIPEDEPHHAMTKLITKLSHVRSDTQIILQTGRPERYRAVTGQWLKKYGLASSYDILLMRENGDFCDNITLKLRFLEWIVDYTNRPTTDILWFEDSERVVKAINKQGVLCLSAQHFPGLTIPTDHQEIPNS